MPSYIPVIGLEVHAQLATRTKIFCACANRHGDPPNTNTCPVCLGLPGALPVLNRAAVELAVRMALAAGCTVHGRSVFARKNYFYPDLAKGYQITQYDRPLATGGAVQIEIEGRPRLIKLVRIHLEEDAGKLVHEGLPSSRTDSHVDFNRAGVPLIEIVSTPEIRTPEEAYLCLQRLRSLLTYTGVCDGSMEKGSLRCDANVSLGKAVGAAFGTKVELKNLNSFRNVQRALAYEIARQSAVLERGGEVTQETRLYDASAGETRTMRSKEEAHDYRYFPEPDLPPLEIDEGRLGPVRAGLPELPAQRKSRFIGEWGLPEREAHLLTLEKPLADYFEEAVSLSGDAREIAKLVLRELQRWANEEKVDSASLRDRFLPSWLAAIARARGAGAITATTAAEVLEAAWRGGEHPEALIGRGGLARISDVSAIAAAVARVIEENPRQVAQYKKGKEAVFGFLVGQVMKATGGMADPAAVNRLLKEALEAL